MPSFTIREHKIPCQHIREYPRALANEQEDVLHLAVKQYIPIDNPNPRPGDITIVAAHANGFPKELYEPLWEDLLTRAKKHNFRIRSIWMSDVASQGASSALNEELLGNDPSWMDHGRDLLHMINLKRDEMPRPLIGLGHSMGGAHIVNVAYMHPRLFTTVILLDPVIQIQSAEVKVNTKELNPARLSTFRRDVWPSREHASNSYKSNAFYQRWDSRVLDRWCRYGLRDLPTLAHPEVTPANEPPKVTLATPVAQEVFYFIRPNYENYGARGKPVDRKTHADVDPRLEIVSPFYRPEPTRTFKHLPELRPSALYIFGSESTVSGKQLNEAKLEATGTGVGGSGGAPAGRVKGIELQGVGHLIAQEAPQKTAEEACQWIEQEMTIWRKDEKEFKRYWKSKTLQQKQMIDEQWKEKIGGPFARAPKEPPKSKI